MTTLISLLLLGAVLWYWQDSLRARERAKGASARACRQAGVQLLDDTVALERMALRRNARGRLCLERSYTFEFTDTGTVRRPGIIVMLGRRVEVLSMDGGDLFVP
jgi:hypothetical protein